MSHSEPPDSDLWFRYLDWSAAQIGRRLAQLSPDEVWQRAHQGELRNAADRPPLSLPAGFPAFYLDLVQAATLVVAGELQLPSFDAWKEAYQQDPAFFERDMLGIRPAASDPAHPTPE